MEALVAELHGRGVPPRLPSDLIAILASDGVERHGNRFSTVYATVACPNTGQTWFTFGGWPAASNGDWQPVPWPW